VTLPGTSPVVAAEPETVPVEALGVDVGPACGSEEAEEEKEEEGGELLEESCGGTNVILDILQEVEFVSLERVNAGVVIWRE
jgi:hypothetical protein